MRHFIREYRRARAITATYYPVIIFSESRYYFQYFEKIFNDILEKTNVPVLYITNDSSDPLLQVNKERLQVVYMNLFLLYIFPRLQAGVVLSTMPGLGTHLYKRSSGVNAYVYLFHAAVSVHQQYLKDAFFKFDAVFALHHQQVAELRKMEVIYNLPEKDIVAYGYPLLDSFRKPPHSTAEKTILIAPSWYDQCIFETCIYDLLKCITPLPYRIVVRPHPEYVKRSPAAYRQLKKEIKKYDNVFLEEDPDVFASLFHADILITDRSGIALEYAFGLLKPVLFIDTPPKIMNTHWKDLEMEPFENKMRSRIGISVLPEQLSTIASVIMDLHLHRTLYREALMKIKDEYFFNADSAYAEGLKYILSKARRPEK